MSTRYPGGLITKTPVTPSGPYNTSSAPGVWTLEQQAQYAKQGIWPTAGNLPVDPQFNYVTMLLHGDGTNGAQNNTFLDSSTNNYTITRSGNTTQGSFSPYGSNWSNYFPNDYIYTTSSIGSYSSNFTIECWVNAKNDGPVPWCLGDCNLSTGLDIQLFTTKVDVITSGAALVSFTTSAWTRNTWNHVAVVRNSGTLTVYVNGTSIGTVSHSATLSGSFYLAAQLYSGSVANGGVQYLSNMRVTNTAVYTSNFTPSTTPLTAISGTALLTCQSNRFLDTSSNAYALTLVGSTNSVQRFNPFGASTAYSTSVIGGSGYFDGSGDYLTTTWSTIGANEFTCEAWVYMFNNSNRYYIVGPGTDTASHFDGFGFEIFNGYLSMWASSNGTGWNLVTSDTSQGRSANVLPVNAWTHVVMTRDSSGVFRSFINGNLQCTVSPGTAALADSGTTVLNIGRARYTGDFANFYGYMSNLRIVNGSVVTAYSTSSTTVGTQIFTPPTAPVTAITNTSLLANFTNGAIFDNAMINDLETQGNAQISTSVYKYGTGSLYFDGSDDRLNIATKPPLNITGDFTIEMWVYMLALPAYSILLDISATGTAGSGMTEIWIQSNGAVAYYVRGTTLMTTASSVITTNAWYHIAVVKSGTSQVLYVNGTNSASATSSTQPGFDLPYWIGDRPAGAGSGQYPLNGYIDDFRITNGYARYTANFTPPTAAFFNTGPN